MVQAIERVPVDSKTDMPRDEVKIVSIDVMDAHDAGKKRSFCVHDIAAAAGFFLACS